MPVTDFKVVIPARYASQRLPGKPLEDLGGWPMLHHVWSRAGESGAAEVVIATDDERIRSAAEGFGARVMMTDPGHRSGSERIVEVLDHDADPDSRLVVNVQGDEPLLPPALIRQAAALLTEDARADVATLAETIDDPAALFDPAVVKVVLDGQENALYFSRAPIPWSRESFGGGCPPNLPSGVPYLRHIGLYAYRAGFLRRYVKAPPAPSEQAESLEQLRVLHMGGRIRVARACEPPGPGVDTPEDLAAVRALIAARGAG